jgi:hypothetical protein
MVKDDKNSAQGTEKEEDSPSGEQTIFSDLTNLKNLDSFLHLRNITLLIFISFLPYRVILNRAFECLSLLLVEFGDKALQAEKQ